CHKNHLNFRAQKNQPEVNRTLNVHPAEGAGSAFRSALNHSPASPLHEGSLPRTASGNILNASEWEEEKRNPKLPRVPQMVIIKSKAPCGRGSLSGGSESHPLPEEGVDAQYKECSGFGIMMSLERPTPGHRRTS
ncbi:hypothetical protein HispidOSU_031816, partial [Sigmodon hispidus]